MSTFFSMVFLSEFRNVFESALKDLSRVNCFDSNFRLIAVLLSAVENYLGKYNAVELFQ